jgi:integrase/recombinase XerD
MGNVQVEEITPNDLNKLMGYLKNDYVPHRMCNDTGEKISAVTLADYWKVIRCFFKWANDDLGIPRPDTKLVRPKYKLKEVKAFSQEDLKRLMVAAEWSREFTIQGKGSHRRRRPSASRDIALLKFMLDTGLRLGELSRVKREDVDLETGQVMVIPFGSGLKSRPRMVYLGNSARKALWLYLAKNPKVPSDNLFGLSAKRIRAIIWDIGKCAGVDHCHPHRFRHTFAIEFLRNQKDPYALQRLLGHSTMDMTRHYLDIVEEDLRRVHGSASPVDKMKL